MAGQTRDPYKEGYDDAVAGRARLSDFGLPRNIGEYERGYEDGAAALVAMNTVGYVVEVARDADVVDRTDEGPMKIDEETGELVPDVEPQPVYGVGDLDSTKPGTGARFNADKAKMQYVPMRVVAATEGSVLLHTVADFEEGDDWAIYGPLQAFTRKDWEDICAVFDYGAKKYAEWNWAKGMKWSIPLACIKRHALAIGNGEVNDPESGLPHRAHIGCNIVMLAHFVQRYPKLDDRPPPWAFGKQTEETE